MLEGHKQLIEDEPNLSLMGTPEEFASHFNQAIAAKFPTGTIPLRFMETAEYPEEPEGTKYILYSPLEYARRGFVDVALIEKLKKGENMLSVGVGPAYLEQAIQKVFNIPKSQITLADKKLFKDVTNLDFPRVEFDMSGEWPETLGKFSIIIFPESFGFIDLNEIRNHPKKSSRIVERNPKIENDDRYITDTVYYILSGEQIISSERIQDFCSMVERDIPRAKIHLNILRSALNHLKQPGQIKISGHLMQEEEMAYVITKLKAEYPTIKFSYPGARSRPGNYGVVFSNEKLQIDV